MYHYLADTPIPDIELETIQLFYNNSFFKNGYIWQSDHFCYHFKSLKNFQKDSFLLNTFYLECYNLTLIQFGWPNMENYPWSKIDFFWFVGKLPINFVPGSTIGGSFCEIISKRKQTTHYFIQKIELISKSIYRTTPLI